MKVLVTGGAGFLGINLIRHLLKIGHKVVSLDIADFDYPEWTHPNLTLIRGSILDYDALEHAMVGVDMVVHAASALPLYTKEEIYNTIVKGTDMVLEASFHNDVKRFIYISTTAVYGVPDHHPLYEDDKLIGVGDYGSAKIIAESSCEFYRRKGMTVTILRPKSFIGPERLGVFALLYDWASTKHNFPIIGKGDNRYQLLDVEDLCAVIYKCMTIKKWELINDTFNVGAKQFGTIKDDYQALLTFAGYGKRIKCLPKGITVSILRLLEKLKLSPLYKWVYETVTEDSFVSIDKLENVLKYTPKYSNVDALKRNYFWYINNKKHFAKREGITHRVPWKQGLLRFAKVFF